MTSASGRFGGAAAAACAKRIQPLRPAEHRRMSLIAPKPPAPRIVGLSLHKDRHVGGEFIGQGLSVGQLRVGRGGGGMESRHESTLRTEHP